MTHPSSAREALIVEALGTVANLLDRVDALTESVDAARLALDRASAQLHSDLETLDADIDVIAQQAKVATVQHVLKRVSQAARDAIASHGQAMATAARQAFSEQADSNFARLVRLLQSVLEQVDRPWEIWATHAATAAATALLSWCVYSCCMPR